MDKADALALLQQDHAAIWESQGWQDFRTYRQEWDNLIRRRAPQTLNPSVMQFLAATNTAVDIQSPDLEKDLDDRLAYLLGNAPKIECIPLDKSKHGKENVEDVRIWSAGSWLRQDDGKKISRHVYSCLTRYGLAVERKTWNMPPEPSDDEMKRRMAEKSESKLPTAEKRMKCREEYFEDYFQDEECFGWQPVHPLEISFFPLSDPEVFIQDSVVSYLEARNLQNADGKSLRLTKDNKAIFVGDGEPVDETERSGWHGKQVHVTIRAAKNKTTGYWDVTEWVREGTSKIGDAEQLNEYVCPSKLPPYHIATASEQVTEVSAHLRFRPMIYPLIVDIQELNALVTLLVQVSVWHLQNPFYVRLDGASPELLQAIEGMQDAGLGVVMASGAERKFVFRTPDPGSGEVMATPRLEAMPNATLPEAFAVRLQMIQQNIMDHRSNRYLTGQAQETAEQPATTTLNQYEASATPFGPYVDAHAGFVKDWLQAEHEMITYWDEGSEKGMYKPYPIPVRGDEPVSSNSYEAGDVVTISAEKLKTRHFLTVSGRNETQAEHAMNQQLADLAYEKGAITKAEWLKLRGADDPEKQIEDLEKEKQQQLAEQHFQQVLSSSYGRLFQALTGLDEALVSVIEQPMEGEAAPAQNGQTQPMLAKPQMTPAPVAGATGSSSPYGGPMG